MGYFKKWNAEQRNAHICEMRVQLPWTMQCIHGTCCILSCNASKSIRATDCKGTYRDIDLDMYTLQIVMCNIGLYNKLDLT